MSPSKLVALMHGASCRRDVEDEKDLSDDLGCLYIDYSDLRPFLDELESSTVDEGKLNGAAYRALRNMAEGQLSFGCGVFMVSPIEPDEYRSHLDGLVALGDAYGVPLTVVEVRRELEGNDESEEKGSLNDIPHLIVHLGDSERMENRCASPDIDFLPTINSFVQYFDSMPGFDRDGGSGIPDSATFRHFSHRHPLLLKTGELSNVEKADHCCCICTASVAGQPFYSCLCCGFFLHKQCAELPQNVKSPIHSHHLRLVIASWEKSGSRLFHYRSYSDRNPEFNIKCLLCDSKESLPFYGCFHCTNLFVHHNCIRSLQNVIQHRAHPHPLTMEMMKTYWFSDQDGYRCHACGGVGDKISYRCRECDFDFHVKCVRSLPNHIRHKRHSDHPLQLSMPPKDETNEYYCEVCAERRHPDFWIYYCKECEYEAHPQCVLLGIPRYDYIEEQ